MQPYDEQQGQSFIFDCAALAMRAKAPLNVGMVIFGLRMQRDYDEGLSYADSRVKHLHEMWEILESQGFHSTEPTKYAPANVVPENIQTVDIAQVSLRIKYWLTYCNVDNQADEDYWLGIVMDTLYHEGHTPGWTADSYWPDLIKSSYHVS